ncbi:MAG: hypothetical protein V4508_15590 [Pseudomonadota bacterium]
MNKTLGIVLVACGLLGLAYGGFSYTHETEKASLGPIKLSVSERENVNIPLWASLAALVAGGALLAMSGRKG